MLHLPQPVLVGGTPAAVLDRHRHARANLLGDTWLIVDLGSRAGWLTWLRGLFTLGALCAAAGTLAPSLTPIAGGTPAGYSSGEYNEASAQAIAPLAFGSFTGRPVAPTSAVRFLIDAPDQPQVSFDATLRQGDSFADVLARAGLRKEELARVVELVSDVVKPSGIAPGTVISFMLGRRPDRSVARPLEQLRFRVRFDLAIAVRRVAGALALVREPITVDDTLLRIQGQAGNGLYLAARAAGAPATAVDDYIRTLNRWVPLGSVNANDRFDLIFTNRRDASGKTQTGELLYVGLHHDRHDVAMMRWLKGDKTQWFDESGAGEQRNGMHIPVDSTRITSGFGMRMHPLLGYSRMHKGIDYGAPYGAPIMAATDGVVRFAGWHGGHGNYVMLNHADNLTTAYAHMSRILVRVGTHVSAGEVIGYVGATGLTTGPHLHYEAYRDGVAIDPSTLRFSITPRLTGIEMTRFKVAFTNLLAVQPANKARQASAISTKTRIDG